MTFPNPADTLFLEKISGIIGENLSNEQFGVSELASHANMSRSNLLRKIKKLTNLSASQFIRQHRLEKAMELLKESTYNVTEISYQVGFSSTSYFIKCFHDLYGFPPGEAGKRDFAEKETELAAKNKTKKGKRAAIFLGGIAIILIGAFLLIFLPGNTKIEKSIAVLPFQNDSNDSSNVYLVNGLMESILNNLQSIEDMRVISRTSSEKYRDNPMLISEIARELDVNYLLEGSGQKIGNQIMLNVQLIDARNDKHLWAEQYVREAEDIFTLQLEVAKSIATEVKAIITPEESTRIEKAPTDDHIAYDFFLKGLYFMYNGEPGDLDSAEYYYSKAIERDEEFARAYASIAITYFFSDLFRVEKLYTELINTYADKALLLDPQLAQSLIAKAAYFLNTGDHSKALPYLEKALEYNPNSTLVINILSEYYTSYDPNIKKYLEYALLGLKLEFPSSDSISASYSYLHIANAFIQAGFVDQAEKYINKSLVYNPDNLYSAYVKAFILYAKENDLEQTKELLIEALKKDSTRLDILQEVAKIYYFMRDYESAYRYYAKFNWARDTYGLSIYPAENSKIAVVYSEMGMIEEYEDYFERFRKYSESDNSIYKELNYVEYYSYIGQSDKAIEALRKFSKETDYNYWIITFFEMDPLLDNIRDNPEFIKLMEEIENKFWKNHEQIRSSLVKKGLI